MINFRLLFILMTISSTVISQNIYSKLSKEDVFIGDKVEFSFYIKNISKIKIQFPDINVNNTDITINNKESTDSSAIYIAQFWRVGEHIFPQLVFIAFSASGSIDTLYSDHFNINVQSILSSNSNNIRDIKKNYRIEFPYFMMIILILIITFSLYMILRILRYKKGIKALPFKKVNYISPYELSLEELTNLELPLQNNQSHMENYYLKITEILKLYLKKTMYFSATEMTTSDIINYLNSKNISSSILKKLSELLVDADMCKFASENYSSKKLSSDKSKTIDLIKTLYNKE